MEEAPEFLRVSLTDGEPALRHKRVEVEVLDFGMRIPKAMEQLVVIHGIVHYVESFLTAA